MSYHKQSLTCAACAYPAARLRKCIFFIYFKMDGQRKYNKEKELELVE
jgi:ribosomal protein L37E